MNKLLILVLLLASLLLPLRRSEAQTSPSCAQLPNLACVGGDAYSGAHDFGTGASLEIPNSTVAGMPAAAAAGRLHVVTDALTTDTCATGGGTERNICIDTGAAWVVAGDGQGAGGMSSFTVAGDTGTPQTITDGNTYTVSGTATGIDTSCAATDTCIVALDTTEVESTTWGAGAGASLVWTFNVSGTDTTATMGSGLLTLSHDLTVSGGDITLGTTSIFSGGDTASLNNIDAINATTETTLEGAIDIAGDVAGTGLSAVAIQPNAVQGTDISLASEATSDLMYFNGTDWVRRAIGSDGQTFKVSGGVPAWVWGVVWNEKICLTADCTAVDAPCDCCTGAGAGCGTTTFTLAGTPRSDCNDTWGSGGTISVWSNGIQQKCVAAAPGINEFALTTNVLTPNAGSSIAYVTYEQ